MHSGSRRRNRGTGRLRHPAHVGVRTAMRVVGPGVAVVGLVFLVMGVADFFSAFGEFGSPRKFWMFFVGIPLLGVGIALMSFGFMGAAARYVAGETMPVATDAVNYVARGTKDSVREIAQAVAEGLRGDRDDEESDTALCPECNEENDADAKFCDNCGTPFRKDKACPSCGESNDLEANFCDSCGDRL